MGILIPNLNILPESQKLLWSQLKPTPKDFVLYGGTALALRLGHRESVDFDFFSCRSFQPLQLLKAIAYLKDQTVTQQSTDTLSCEIETEKGDVKISSYFEDLTGPLSEKVKADLIGAVKSVSLQNLPVITASQKIGDSTGRISP